MSLEISGNSWSKLKVNLQFPSFSPLSLIALFPRIKPPFLHCRHSTDRGEDNWIAIECCVCYRERFLVFSCVFRSESWNACISLPRGYDECDTEIAPLTTVATNKSADKSMVCLCVCLYSYSRSIYIHAMSDTNSFSTTSARKTLAIILKRLRSRVRTGISLYCR